MSDYIFADGSSLDGHLNALSASVQQCLALFASMAPGLMRVRDDGAGNLTFPKAVTHDGQTILGLPESAPSDASIPNGHCAIWNNAGTLTFRLRNLAGTLSTKTL